MSKKLMTEGNTGLLQLRSLSKETRQMHMISRVKDVLLKRIRVILLFLCFGTIAGLFHFQTNGEASLKRSNLMTEHQIKSAALRRASWDTYLDHPQYSPRRTPFARPRRAFVSSLHTESYYPLALGLGYSLAQTNDLAAQDAEMVLFVRKAANVSTEVLNKLKRVGWKLRFEDDLTFEGVDLEQISPNHRHNLNKLRFWSWVEYDRILFIDADTLVKRDLSEVWDTPGSKTTSSEIELTTSYCSGTGFMAHRSR